MKDSEKDSKSKEVIRFIPCDDPWTIAEKKCLRQRKKYRGAKPSKRSTSKVYKNLYGR